MKYNKNKSVASACKGLVASDSGYYKQLCNEHKPKRWHLLLAKMHNVPLQSFALSLFFLFFYPSLLCSEENFVGRHIFSFDLKGAYYSSETDTARWGFGVSLEGQISPFLSVRADAEYDTLFHFVENNRTVTVALGVAPLFYPFSRGLDWLYLGCGICTEFLIYKDNSIKNDHDKDTMISLVPQIGWKQNFFNFVMLDVFCAYNIELSNTDIPDYAEDLVNSDFEAGFKLKFNLQRILRSVFQNS